MARWVSQAQPILRKAPRRSLRLCPHERRFPCTTKKPRRTGNAVHLSNMWWFSEGAPAWPRSLTPALSQRERGLFGACGEFGVIPERLPPPVIPENANPGFASKLAPTKSQSALALAFGLPEKYPSAPERPFRRPNETRAQEVMRHGCRESPDGLQGRTLGAGLRGGGIREGSPAPSGPYAGQAFLVPFVAFDKRDSPEGAKQDGRANSERRRNTQAKAAGLFPFGPAQALFAMEPRPAFAGMTK